MELRATTELRQISAQRTMGANRQELADLAIPASENQRYGRERMVRIYQRDEGHRDYDSLLSLIPISFARSRNRGETLISALFRLVSSHSRMICCCF